MNIEFFDPIPGYPNYYASKEGNILSTKYKKDRVLKSAKSNCGYLRVSLSMRNKKKNISVHTLIMLTFEGECPDGEEVDHINHIRTDNRFENLRYCTKSENMRNQIIIGSITIDKRIKKKFRVEVQVYFHPAKNFTKSFHTREEAERVRDTVSKQANLFRKLLLEIKRQI